MSARPPPPPRPRLSLPPRSTGESLFSGTGDASPGPLTLASALFPSDADADAGGGGGGSGASSGAGPTSFTQLLIGSLSQPPPHQQQQQQQERGRGGVARAGPALSVAPPAGAAVFTVPPGLSPSGFFDSPGLIFSPAMGGFGMSHQQALAQVTAQASHSPHRMFDHTEQPSFSAAATSSGALQNMSSAANVAEMSEMATTISNNEHAAFQSAEASHRYQVPAPVDKPADDGYNWRKYGQKVVKGSDCPRSYYKCTHPSCPVKKKVEHAEDGHISEIIYKGKHNHQRPPNKRAKDGSSSAAEQNEQSNDTASGLSGVRRDQEAVYGMSEQLSGLSDGDDKDDGESRPNEVDDRENDCKRRNIQISSQKALTESKIIVQTTSEVDLLDDGYRWRKYGQKVVKGNPHPRSYYKCTFAGCNVRKHIERASSDPKAVITTYEGKHNHEPPVGRGSNQNGGNSNRSQQKGPNSMSSNQASHTGTDLGNIKQGQIGVLQFKREE
ncbi:probable WRKY transcription factor 3 [Aegilops tauschii subsp. strangulata]|uniref:WRKY domain-containing protein n=2 Tax=Aegilops tauschii subsp. strangulata TaxID=200361 RepID=A0A453K352_AEGTS|nr:probable WRKY transcription factor 4 [Aegilops tauschii subsp. strangulata]